VPSPVAHTPLLSVRTTPAVLAQGVTWARWCGREEFNLQSQPKKGGKYAGPLRRPPWGRRRSSLLRQMGHKNSLSTPPDMARWKARPQDPSTPPPGEGDDPPGGRPSVRRDCGDVRLGMVGDRRKEKSGGAMLCLTLVQGRGTKSK